MKVAKGISSMLKSLMGRCSYMAIKVNDLDAQDALAFLLLDLLAVLEDKSPFRGGIELTTIS
jgi:hypothetical protein